MVRIVLISIFIVAIPLIVVYSDDPESVPIIPVQHDKANDSNCIKLKQLFNESIKQDNSIFFAFQFNGERMLLFVNDADGNDQYNSLQFFNISTESLKSTHKLYIRSNDMEQLFPQSIQFVWPQLQSKFDLTLSKRDPNMEHRNYSITSFVDEQNGDNLLFYRSMENSLSLNIETGQIHMIQTKNNDTTIMNQDRDREWPYQTYWPRLLSTSWQTDQEIWQLIQVGRFNPEQNSTSYYTAINGSIIDHGQFIPIKEWLKLCFNPTMTEYYVSKRMDECSNEAFNSWILAGFHFDEDTYLLTDHAILRLERLLYYQEDRSYPIERIEIDQWINCNGEWNGIDDDGSESRSLASTLTTIVICTLVLPGLIVYSLIYIFRKFHLI